MFITHNTVCYSYVDSARMALEGGCRLIQLRMKDAGEDEWLQVGGEIGELCRYYGAQFIVNDHVELVRKLGADGVHLGKSDMRIDVARWYLGSQCVIGATANTIDDIRLNVSRGADYIGLGPFRFTSTKINLSPILGLEGYRNIVSKVRAEGVDIPIFAIGGITAEDVESIMRTGVSGIALSGTILRAGNPIEETKHISSVIDRFVDKYKKIP